MTFAGIDSKDLQNRAATLKTTVTEAINMAEINTFVIGGLGAEARENAVEKLRNTWRYKELKDEINGDMLYEALASHLQFEGTPYDNADVEVDGDDVTVKVSVEHAKVSLELLERMGLTYFNSSHEYELIRDILGVEDLYYDREAHGIGSTYILDTDVENIAHKLYGDLIEDGLATADFEIDLKSALDALRDALYKWYHNVVDDFTEEARHTVATAEDDGVIDALCEETMFTADGTPTEVA